MKTKTSFAFFIAFVSVFTARAQIIQPKSFNNYLLQAIDSIDKNCALKGYSISSAYTHDLPFGKIKFKATNPPLTMCVAAQMEIIITALNIYISETRDSTCLKFLPAEQWRRAKNGSLKDLIWVNSGSSGTADALTKFGMGQIVSFKELNPGSFINLNRTKTGHAVLFIAYINAKGEEVAVYSNEVKGFKYYSSQGKKDVGKGGFGYRYAFFGNLCPQLDSTKKRDCGVIFSNNQKLLNCGIMLSPKFWNSKIRDKRLKVIDNLENVGSINDNQVNKKYMIQNTTDD